MKPREWVLSAFFVAFLAVKLLEGWLAVESWPFSHLPMFAERMPAGARPFVLTLHGLQHGRWIQITPWMLGLNEAELNARLKGTQDIAAACGELMRSFNDRRPPRRRLSAAYVLRRTLTLPGTGEAPVETRTDCSPQAPAA
jgi:hypothetical protein